MASCAAVFRDNERMNWLRGVSIVLAAVAVTLAAWHAGWLESFELQAYDALVRRRAPLAPREDRVVLVVAREADLDRYGWPASDEVLADVLTAIRALCPRAVAVDLYRGQPRPPGSARLDSLLRAHRDVIFVEKFGEAQGRYTAAPPALAASPAQVGFADILEDHDGVVRKALLFLDDAGRTGLSLGLQAALAYLAVEGIRPVNDESVVRIGRAALRPLESDDGPYVGADAGGYQILLDYAGGQRPFPTYSFSQLLEGKIGAEALRGRIVFVGIAAGSVKDYFSSPFREGRGAVEPAYGVSLHAHTASQLVRMAKGETPPMRLPSAWQEALWIVWWCVAGALIALLRRRLWLAAALALAGAAGIAAAGYAAFAAYFWLPVAGPLFGFALSAGALLAWLRIHESAERRTLMQIFSRYVSQPLAADIWKNRRELLEHGRLTPRRIEVSVMFTDIAGFTAISEKLAPDALMDWLSEYLGAMAEIVHAHGGVVEKFMGDGIMAVFGLYGERAGEHARLAVDCALAMRGALDALNAGWRERGLPPVGIRIGIHSGPVAYGTVGHGARVESTVLGDTTNIASRLESLKQEPGAPKIDARDPEDPENLCRILVSETTLGMLGGAFASWRVGPVQLKGKAEVLQVYGIRGPAGPAGSASFCVVK